MPRTMKTTDSPGLKSQDTAHTLIHSAPGGMTLGIFVPGKCEARLAVVKILAVPVASLFPLFSPYEYLLFPSSFPLDCTN